MTLKPDFSAAQFFLDLLGPDEEFTFLTLPERDKRDRTLTRVFHGTLAQHFEQLTALNQRGAGIFFMVNRGDGVVHDGAKTCRTESNVTGVRALFVDLDGAPIEPVLQHAMPPGIVVESSPGRWHAYWRTPDCPLDQFRVAQQRLATNFGGDRSVCDLPRVMRLPGFYHLKTDTPYLSRVVNTSEFEVKNEQA